MKMSTWVEGGKMSHYGFSFISEVNKSFVVFDFVNTLKLDLKTMQHVRMELRDVIGDNEVLAQESIDLTKSIDNVYFENMIHHPFTLTFKDIKVKALVQLIALYLPKSLEQAHMTLNKQLIKTNVARFAQVVEKSETYNKCRHHFFPPEYIEQMRS